MIIVPGPDWAFAISAGLAGWVVPAITGIVLGYLGMTVLLAVGGGALVATSPTGLTALTVVGGGYLVWIGIKTFVSRPGPAGPATDHATELSARTVLVRGIGSAARTKGLLTLVAILPQFANPASRWPMAGQLGALGLLFTLTCAVTCLIVASCSLRVPGSRPGTARAVSRISAFSMIAIGIALLRHRGGGGCSAQPVACSNR